MDAGDVRRPAHVHRFEAMPQARKGARNGYSAATATPEVAPGTDTLAMVSMLLGAAGMATRVKALAWVALFAGLSAAANWRRPDGDARAVVGAFMYVGACACACALRIVSVCWIRRWIGSKGGPAQGACGGGFVFLLKALTDG